MTGHSLYVGEVNHRRLRPRPHTLRYRVYMLLIDLDEPLPPSRILKSGRRGLMSFQPTDHGDGSHWPLRSQALEHLKAIGVRGSIGRVSLLTMPRIFGYGFNPISIYWCYRPNGELAGIVHEVTNTFGERHCYASQVDPSGAGVHRHSAPKSLHVSPFMDMDMTYDFRLKPPGEAVQVIIDLKDAEGVKLTASFVGTRRPFGDRELFRAWASLPFLTLKVMVGIHWEALKLLLKGHRYRRKPPPPVTSTTSALSTAPPRPISAKG